MTLGLVTDRTKGTEPDHMVEFREGVELLKNEYPEKALLKLRRAFESDKRNPYYISFLVKRFRAKVVERRTPVLPFLGRGHFLNRELGKLRHRMLKRGNK